MCYTGDSAYNATFRLQKQVDVLRGQVERLNNTLSDLLTVLAADGTIEVTDPDSQGHIEDKD